MTWNQFYSWLESNGLHWFPGDIHLDGAGFWYPGPPDVSGGRVQGEPLVPPPPWVLVFKSAIEEGKKTVTAVDVITSFNPPQYEITNPVEAQRVVERALMDFDMAAGADAPMAHRVYPEPAPTVPQRGRARPMTAEALRKREEFEALPRSERTRGTPMRRVWEEKGDEAMRRWQEMVASRAYEPMRRPASESPLYKGEPLKLKGFGNELPVKTCSCGRSYTAMQWEELPFLGKQKLEATEDEAACELEARNCGKCGSTLMIEV